MEDYYREVMWASNKELETLTPARRAFGPQTLTAAGVPARTCTRAHAHAHTHAHTVCVHVAGGLWTIEDIKEWFAEHGGAFAALPSSASSDEQVEWLREQERCGILTASPTPTCAPKRMFCSRNGQQEWCMPFSTNKIVVCEAKSVACFDALTLHATAISPEVHAAFISYQLLQCLTMVRVPLAAPRHPTRRCCTECVRFFQYSQPTLHVCDWPRALLLLGKVGQIRSSTYARGHFSSDRRCEPLLQTPLMTLSPVTLVY